MRKHRQLAASLDVGIWTRAVSMQSENGDVHVAKPVESGVLIAVIDGLGHGSEAAVAARAAVSCLETYAGEKPITLLQECHRNLKRTRGVVMSLALLDDVERTLTWIGVGNVEGVLIRADRNANPARERILLRGGVVGLELPALHASVMPISPGDTLVFATDGIARAFADDLIPCESAQGLADRIGADFYKGGDDALVFVGRYRSE